MSLPDNVQFDYVAKPFQDIEHPFRAVLDDGTVYGTDVEFDFDGVNTYNDVFISNDDGETWEQTKVVPIWWDAFICECEEFELIRIIEDQRENY